MELSLTYIRSKLLKPFKSETSEIQEIEKIFQIFNFERDRISEYTQTQEFVSAYTLFYLSTNVSKWQACLNRLPEQVAESILNEDIVEVGTGPGTFALAASLGQSFKANWYGVDQSQIMLDQAKRIFEDRKDRDQYQFMQVLPVIKGATLLFTHSLNEMSLEKAQGLIEKLEPKRVIWIEPGTKDFFQKAYELRSYLLKKSFDVITPCLGANKCPAAQIEGEWCHQIIKVTHPPDIERLCQKLSRDRRSMPVSFHVYSKEQPLKDEPSVSEGVIFRMRKSSKHAQDMQICTNEQKLEELEVSFRGLDKSQEKELQSRLAGEKIEFEVIKELQDKKRVILP